MRSMLILNNRKETRPQLNNSTNKSNSSFLFAGSKFSNKHHDYDDYIIYYIFILFLLINLIPKNCVSDAARRKE